MILLGCFGWIWSAGRESVSFEDAFWAYDDGKIGYEELEDLLAFIEMGDVRSACAEWEALDGDPCQKSLSEKLSELKFRGSAKYAVSLDSAGGIRNEQLFLQMKLWRFSGEWNVRSEYRETPVLERARIAYRGKYLLAAAGDILASDVGSAIPLQKGRGGVLTAAFRNARVGAFLLTDSTAGTHAFWRVKEAFELSGMGSFSFDGFREAFGKISFPNVELQMLSSRNWRTPLWFISGENDRKEPLRARFRAYFHQNDSLPGLFRLPKRVEESRAFADAQVQMFLSPWSFRWNARLAIPLDTAKTRSFSEIHAERKSSATLSLGFRTLAVGDSVSVTWILRGGLRLFAAESLFAEWKVTPDYPFSKSLYEIRPGISVRVEERVFSKWLFIVRGPGTKPLILRWETQMDFAERMGGKTSVELRAERLRQMRLWRLGMQFHLKW